MAYQSFFQELRRRHVIRIATAYIVAAWLLLQLGAIILPTLHAPSWCESVLLAFLILGFPVALILAWAFESTPEGVRRTVPTEGAEARLAGHGRHVGRVLNVAIIVVLAAAVGVLVWQRFGAGPNTLPVHGAPSVTTKGVPPASATVIPAKSIAVLPFENLSEDKGNKYFADGMQDLVLTKLADIGDLKVISRTSTLQYGSHPQNLRKIGRELGVATLLEGSVQKAGNSVLINVQLIDARSDNHLWAQTYQRTLDNIFGVEGEVAEKIAVALSAKLDPAEQARVLAVPTRSPAAYDAYLRGVSIENDTSDISAINLKQAAAFYEKAVKLDPGFALAWARLSSANSNVGFNEGNPVFFSTAKRALARAVALAPGAAATLIAQGNYAYYAHLDYPTALAAFRKVLKIVPNSAEAQVDIGFVRRRQGHFRAAIDAMNRSLVLDPRNVVTLSNLGFSYWGLHDDAKAKEMYRRALSITPNDAVVSSLLASVFQSEGDLARASAILAGVKISPSDWVQSYPVAIQQAILMRHYEEAIKLLQKGLATPDLSEAGKAYYYEILGFVERLEGNDKAAQAATRETVKRVKPLLTADRKKIATNAFLYILLAEAQARLGDKEAALTAAQHAVEMVPVSRDAFSAPIIAVGQAVVQMEVGKKSQAVDTLRHILALPPGGATPSTVSPALLRIDPIWNPLRSDPAFRALLKQYPLNRPASGTDTSRAYGATTP